MQQIGISPKVVGQALATVVVWLLGYFAVQLPPEVASAIALALGAGAGYFAPPGAVVHEHPPTASDDLMSPDVARQVAGVEPPA